MTAIPRNRRPRGRAGAPGPAAGSSGPAGGSSGAAAAGFSGGPAKGRSGDPDKSRSGGPAKGRSGGPAASPGLSGATREPGELFGPRFELFADVLVLGLVISLCCLPLLTAPAALATGCTLLRRRLLYDEPATAGRFLAVFGARLRSAPGRELAAGAVLAGGALLVLADLLLAGAGLPGAPLFAVVLALLTGCGAVVALRACALPDPPDGTGSGAGTGPGSWRRAVRSAAVRSAADLPGSGLVLLALATAAVCGWMLPPLLFLVPGPLALALTAVEAR